MLAINNFDGADALLDALRVRGGMRLLRCDEGA